MRTRGKSAFSGWPSWRYGPEGQAEIFQREEDVPDGWGRKPGETGPVFVPKPTPPVLDRTVLIDELHRYGVEINPTWGVAHMKKVIDDCTATR